MRATRGPLLAACLLVGSSLAAAPVVQNALQEVFDRFPDYQASADLADPVHQLAARVADGRARLTWKPERGYLDSVLRELSAPASSQTLVFSKTSEQIDFIGPKTPRAIYMGEDVYVAWSPGSPHLELAAADPAKGAVFYTLAQAPSSRPRFERAVRCLRCHLGPKTLDVPGFLVRSAKTASDGRPLSQVTAFVSGHSSPMRERWAGWYVTGTMANDVHLGNSVLDEARHADTFDPEPGSRVVDLRDRFDTTRYPVPTSDVVALLVLDHSVRMRDLIARAGYETRLAVENRRAAAASAGQVPDWSSERIVKAADQLLGYMLFRDEQPLKGRVTGTSAFAEDFMRAGPRDRRGRSLRALDLERRLFVYPCSYLIYSATFDGLPAEMKDVIWRRLDEILGGADHSAAFQGMAAADRAAVRDILLDTKPEFRSWVERHPRH